MTYLNPNHWKSPVFKRTDHSTQQSSPSVASYRAMVTGSDIYYTPPSDATSVVYEISFYGEKQGRCDVEFNLQHYVSSAWSEIDQRYLRNIANTGDSQRYRWLNRLQFVIPTWTGEKRVALWIGSHADNRNMLLHKIPEYDGASSNTTFFSTHLIVYSV